MYHVQISLKSFESALLQQGQNLLFSAQEKLFSKSSGKVPNVCAFSPPTNIKKFTVLRSPHIDKKSREQFQLKRFKRVFVFRDFQSLSQALFLLECFKHLTFPGIQMNVKIVYPSAFKSFTKGGI